MTCSPRPGSDRLAAPAATTGPSSRRRWTPFGLRPDHDRHRQGPGSGVPPSTIARSSGVGIHAAPRATRFEALEASGRARPFRGFAKNIAAGLSSGTTMSQYMSDVFQKELDFLGAESSPAFVRAPEGNGWAERFIRTLKENLLWVQTFDTVEDLRQALLAFRETYNATWLIERHGFTRPQLFG